MNSNQLAGVLPEVPTRSGRMVVMTLIAIFSGSVKVAKKEMSRSFSIRAVLPASTNSCAASSIMLIIPAPGTRAVPPTTWPRNQGSSASRIWLRHTCWLSSSMGSCESIKLRSGALRLISSRCQRPSARKTLEWFHGYGGRSSSRRQSESSPSGYPPPYGAASRRFSVLYRRLPS